ncbi:alkaline-phosphatase-like protein [Mycena rosella]|uniref:Alkaline-phosphatase-like protein n=1 Tax=Mycena rosella TaxID=1033263 RepID=A0AAD7BFW3_MYCRO|nr:alkaline-phosphatase-like protein [Mycena rosella]
MRRRSDQDPTGPKIAGYTKFTEEGLNDNYLPVWLQNAGYSTFILDPEQYVYMNSIWQTGTGMPENFPGEHTLDINNERAFAYLDDAAEKDVPFFLTIAPVAPHAQVIVDLDNPQIENRNIRAPVPQAKWSTSFLDEKVPWTPKFHPDVVILQCLDIVGGSWIRDLPQLDADTVAYNDAFYVARLQLLAGFDEMVREVISRLNASGLLESMLQPGKSCPIEEDYIVPNRLPMSIRDPNIVNTVTTHTDLAPTFFEMFSIDLRPLIWCDNGHELYDMKNSPAGPPAPWSTQASVIQNIPQLVARLVALTMVLKSCKADACRKPWNVLHPQGNVQNLEDAMACTYYAFYASQPKVSFSECQPGYILGSEGPQGAIPYSG